MTTPKRQLKVPRLAGAPFYYQSKVVYFTAVVLAVLSLTSCVAAVPSPEDIEVIPGTGKPELLEIRGEQNDREAQYILGSRSGSLENHSYWFCRSASRSHSFQNKSMLQLGATYEELGDNVLAFSWYTVAAQHGASEANAALEKLAAVMTVEQTQTATEMAANWKPGNCGDLPAFALASYEAVTASFARRRTEAQARWPKKISQARNTSSVCIYHPSDPRCARNISKLEAERDKVLRAIDEDEKFAREVNELEGQPVGSM